MTAYRDENAALRHRLEMATKRADAAEAKLARLTESRDNFWQGDIPLFIVRCLLVVTPLAIGFFLILYFGVGVGLLDIFDDTRGFMAFLSMFVVPLLFAGPLAAWKTERPSRGGWGLALFTYLYLFALFPPLGLVGLVALLRPRVRDAVFGPEGPRYRVAEEAFDEADEAPADAEEEVEADASRTAGGRA